MADKVDKPKKQKAKAKQGEKGVLAALPSTRPERIGTRRANSAPAPKTTATTEASKAAKDEPSAKPAAKPRATGAGKAGAAKPRAATKPRATATRRKAAAPRTFEPTQAAEAAAGTADAASLRSSPRPAGAGAVPPVDTPPTGEDRTYPRPRPVREGAPGIGTAGYRDGESAESARPSGTDLASTAVHAAAEVAQLGLAIGGGILKRVVDRLPRP